MHNTLTITTLLLAVIASTVGNSQEPALNPDKPGPTPRTRPALKFMLEQVKNREPRIPLPEFTEEDRQELGVDIESYEQRLKYHYLGEKRAERSWSRTADPEASLPYDFKVQLFWIVSRVNNCHYCIGHQETKLLAADQSEDQIAALDCNWGNFPVSHQAAFAFARTLTFSPAGIAKPEFDGLRQHYTDAQILEMVISVAWNNSINRWKEALAVPQNPGEGGYSRAVRELSPAEATAFAELPIGSYLTPTSAQFASVPSSITLDTLPNEDHPLMSNTARRESIRGSAKNFAEIMNLAAERNPRLPMASETETQRRFGELTREIKVLPLWMRTLAVFPQEGLRRAKAILASQAFDSLTPLQRARLTWVVGIQDEAGYVMDLAKTELESLGAWEAESKKLMGDWSDYEFRDRVLMELARDLAHSPVVLTDRTVEQAVQSNGPATVVQAVAHVVGQTALVRLSEAAQLPLESAR